MATIRISRDAFLANRQGMKFADVVDDSDQPFDAVLAFFSNADRQRRMEESELHHDRAALAGVVREFEALPPIDRFLAEASSGRATRLRQAVGVLVRMIMERRGWRKTGKKGSLGVRAPTPEGAPKHNSGGLAFWFVRAERYERIEGTPFRSVQTRCQEYQADASPQLSSKGKNRRAKEGAAR